MLPRIGHHQIGADARDLLGDDHHVEHAAAGAAVFFRERQRQKPGLGAGLVQLLGIGALAIVLAHIFGRRVLLHQLAHAVAQQPLFLGEAEIHDDLHPESDKSARAAKYNPVDRGNTASDKIRRPRGTSMTEPGQMFSDGKTYERMMGRWSKLAAADSSTGSIRRRVSTGSKSAAATAPSPRS